MKRIVKLTLTVACVMFSTSLFAQKFGRVNLNEVFLAMPEVKDMQAKIEALSNDWAEQLEEIKVEFNNKNLALDKDRATLSPTALQVRESELLSLQNRYVELNQFAQQDIERQQNELFTPIQQKALDAVKKIASAGGYVFVFDISSMPLPYVDEAVVTDISDAVRKELGITEAAAK